MPLRGRLYALAGAAQPAERIANLVFGNEHGGAEADDLPMQPAEADEQPFFFRSLQEGLRGAARRAQRSALAYTRPA